MLNMREWTRMLRRGLLLLALVLGGGGVAGALTIDTVESLPGADSAVVITDPLGIVPDSIDDPPPSQAAQLLATSVAVASLVDTSQDPVRTATGTAVSVSIIIPREDRILVRASANVAGSGDPALEATASARSFGEVTFRVEGDPGGTLPFLGLHLERATQFQAGMGSTYFLIENLTTGQTVFSSDDGDAVDEVIGFRFGDLIRLSFEIGAEEFLPTEGTQEAIRTVATLRPFPTDVIPEPGTLLLSLAGLGMLSAASRRRRLG